MGRNFMRSSMIRSKSPQYKDLAGKHEALLSDLEAIRSKVSTQRGLRRVWPWRGPLRSLLLKRAYYVWRIARFYGGADTRLPAKASSLCADDPALEALDDLANSIALEAFGTNSLGPNRWREVLTGRPTPKAPIFFNSRAPPGNNNGFRSTKKSFVR